MMNKFTFIAQYKGGTYISQYDADDLIDAVFSWVNNLDLQYFKAKEIKEIQEKFSDEDFFPIPVNDVVHVWCGAISACGNFLIVNIVKTA